METLFEMGLANAVAVAVLVPAAWLACRITKRPAWAHAVWVIVLLKLITPPVLRVPIGGAFAREDQPVANRVAFSVAGDSLRRDHGSSHAEEAGPSPLVADMVPRVPSHAIAAPSTRLAEVSWRMIVATIWIAGSASWMLLAMWRILRFGRLLRSAPSAPESIVQWVETLSAGLGLRRVPIVVLVNSRVSPMVWSLGGRSRLVIPEPLWERLDDDQKAAMLVHELAHLKRGDPWVRLLEMVATALYWWHPAMWLARNELHRAEESCCDLWVVWALPKAKKQYASALVEAVDFLSESRPKRLPLGASGMGQVEDLSRRIGMIMRSDMPRGLSRTGAFVAITVAAAILPWRPSVAQQDPARPGETATAESVLENPTKPSSIKAEDVVKVPAIEDADKAIRNEFLGLKEVEKLNDEISSLQTQLDLARSRVRAPDGDPAVRRVRHNLAKRNEELQALWEKHYPALKRQLAADGEVVYTEAEAAERTILHEFLYKNPEVDNLRERIFAQQHQIEEFKAKHLESETDPAFLKMRDQLNELKAEYHELWEKSYPEIRARYDKIEEDAPGFSTASPELRAEWKRAKDRLAWSRQMRDKQYVSAAQIAADESAIDKIRARIFEEKKRREDAPKLAEQEKKLLQTQVDVKKANLAKAEAQRQIAAAQHARFTRYEKRGLISKEEMEHTTADLAIAEAGVAEAKALLAEAELELANASERAAMKLGDSVPRDVNQRIDVLESKLESILKEIKDLRKTQP